MYVCQGCIRSHLEPSLPFDPLPVRNPCTMWAQKSTQRPTLGGGGTHGVISRVNMMAIEVIKVMKFYLMMMMFMLVMSIVRPHQCMKPETLMQVKRTHLDTQSQDGWEVSGSCTDIITNMDPLQLPRVIRVVTNIHTG